TCLVTFDLSSSCLDPDRTGERKRNRQIMLPAEVPVCGLGTTGLEQGFNVWGLAHRGRQSTSGDRKEKSNKKRN
uniref:Uncharacterized protein n=1 Tax=Xiphophorus maculatus TaxID=8083 RepID=A0A3B5R0X9_XIPMA